MMPFTPDIAVPELDTRPILPYPVTNPDLPRTPAESRAFDDAYCAVWDATDGDWLRAMDAGQQAVDTLRAEASARQPMTTEDLLAGERE